MNRLVTLTMVGAALAAVACKGSKGGDATDRTEPKEAARPEVAGAEIVELTAAQVAHSKFTVAAVESREAAATLRLPGTLAIDPRRSWRVTSAVDGIVEQVGAVEHDPVKQGHMLLALRSTALGEAQVAWLEARTSLKLAKADRERNLALRKDGVVSDAQWLRVDNAFEVAETMVTLADRKLTLVGLSRGQIDALESPKRRLGYLGLTSPARGIVLASHVTRGQMLAAGETAFELADLSSLWVTVHVPVASLAQVEPGAVATVHVGGGPSAGWDGKVSSLGGDVNAPDQTVEARVVVANPDGFLRPGMYADVSVVGVPVPALMVPAGAAFSVGNQGYVFHRVDERRFRPLAVTLGAPLGDWVPVSGPGVGAGLPVVVGGLAELKSHWLYKQDE